MATETENKIITVYADEITKGILTRAAKAERRSVSSYLVYCALKRTKEVYQGDGNVFC